MVKLNRFTMPVFAGNAAQTQTSVFGTMKTSPQYTTDVAASIGTTAYGNGWADAIEIGYAPYMEDMNTLQRAITYQISYNQQQGIPEWDSSTEYYIGSLAKLNTANGSQVYSSLIDNNVGNLVSDATKWKLVFDTENSYVTTNTAQTITGNKTFAGEAVKQLNSLSYGGFKVQNTQLEKGTTPSSSTGGQFYFQDKDGLDLANRIGGIESIYSTDGNIVTRLSACEPVADSTNSASVDVVYKSDGTTYATAPTPGASLNLYSTAIPTIGWVNTAGDSANNILHKTGNETITGEKTVQDNMLLFKTTATAYNETPTTNQYAGYSWKDKNGAEISAFYSALYASGLGITGGLSGFNLTNKSGNSEIVCLRYDSNGNFFTQAPASDVANSIVTTVNKSKAQSGYFQLGNGLIVQWGRTKVSVLTGASHTPVTTITLPKAFTTTNYSLTGTFESNTSTSASNTDDVTFCTTSISTTSVKGFGYDAGGNTYEAYLRWIAIGY